MLLFISLLPFLLFALIYSLKLIKGKVQYLVLLLLLLIEGAAAFFFKHHYILYATVLPTLSLFFYFYSKELNYTRIFEKRWQVILAFTVIFTALSFLPFKISVPAAAAIYLLIMLFDGELLNLPSAAGIILIFLLCCFIENLLLLYLFSLLSFCLIFYISLYSRKKFAETSEQQIVDALTAYSDEVKATHLQMRSWRHDFHNHIQSMSFLLESGEYDELKNYLHDLDRDLQSIDTVVKSGQISVDAILNSKLSLAKEAKIKLDLTVYPLPELGISDIDLTAILGNLLDNAIESCEKIAEDRRFIRLYLDCIGEQLYFSLQNSAKEDLSFNERNYISEKRGRHGLGMKRVALLVEKYDGVLNLKNEPGVFAVELSFALPKK